MIELRPRQRLAITHVSDAYQNGYVAPILVAPTGFGKTATSTEVIRRAIARGKRVWFIAHLREILQATASRLEAEQIEHSWIASGCVGDRRMPVQCVMIQTLARRLDQYQPPDLMIVDEAHLAVSETYQDVFRWAKAGPKFYERGGAFLLHLTATPRRLDGRGMGEVADLIIPTCGAQELVDEGFLAPVRYLRTPPPDLSGVHTLAGEYKAGELSSVMQKPGVVGSALAHYLQHGRGRPGLGFAVDLAAARRMAEEFRAAGLRCVAVSGDDDTQARDYALTAIQTGELDFVWNAKLWVAGVDAPALSYIADMRPTKSLTQYRQGFGRGMRTHPGKTDLIYADHAGNLEVHGNPLIDLPWTLDGSGPSQGGGAGGMQLRVCRKCFSPNAATKTHCITCGAEFPVKPRTLQEIAGELMEVRLEKERAKKDKVEARMEQGQAKTHSELVALFLARGSSPSAAQYRARIVLNSRTRQQNRNDWRGL